MPGVQALEAPLRQVGRISLISYGIGLILTVAGFYLILGYALSSAGSFQSYTPQVIAYLSLLVASYAFLLVAGIFALLVGVNVGRGAVRRTSVLLANICYSIFLALFGILEIYLSSQPYYGNGSLGASGVFYILSAVMFTTGSVIFQAGTMARNLVGSILGIIGVIFFFIAGANLGLASTSFYALYYFQGTSFLSGIPGGLLGGIGFLIAGIGAVVYSLLKDSKFRSISYVIATIGFLILGISTIIPSLTFLFGPVWQLPGQFLAVLSVSIVGMIFFALAGFLIVTSSGLGIAFFSGQLQLAGSGSKGPAQSVDERASSSDAIGKLVKLKSLLDSGAITRVEFEAEKDKLLQKKPESMTLEEQLRKLKSLLDSGAINQKEYDAEKRKLLDQL